MKKQMVLTAGMIVTMTFFLATGPVSGAPGPAYPEGVMTIDGRKPALFSHQTHIDLGMDCAVCHHDQEHKPLTADMIQAMPDVKQLRCESCHNDSFANSDLQRAKDIFHARCKDCHKEGYAGKKGPTKCSDCHVKKKAAYEGC